MILCAKVIYNGFPKIPKRIINTFARDSLRALGVHWHEKMRPKHFTKAGAREYGYEKRKGEGSTGRGFWKSYTGRKQKKFGHQRPLEWSGESKQRTEHREITATAKRVRVYLRAPAFNFQNRHSNIKMAEEMRTISGPEQRQLSQMFGEMMGGRIAAYRGRRVVRIAAA